MLYSWLKVCEDQLSYSKDKDSASVHSMKSFPKRDLFEVVLGRLQYCSRWFLKDCNEIGVRLCYTLVTSRGSADLLRWQTFPGFRPQLLERTKLLYFKMKFIQVKIHLWSTWTISPRLIWLCNIRSFISKALKVSLYLLMNVKGRMAKNWRKKNVTPVKEIYI